MFVKYPKTFHIQETCFKNYQNECLSFESLVPETQGFEDLILVVEEKMDGTQVGISFDEKSAIKIQSRGSYISSEPEFSLLKQWVWQHFSTLLEILGNRYILFGEWLYARHTMYYDLLPDYFMEFDIFDRENQVFLSTSARQKLIGILDFVSSVRIIDTLDLDTLDFDTLDPDSFESASLSRLDAMIGKSAFISEMAFSQIREEERKQTDTTGLMEGLYLKIEDESKVLKRYKLVRPEFIQKIVESGSHWKQRVLKINRLFSEQSIHKHKIE